MLKYEEVIILFRGRYRVFTERIKWYNATSYSLTPYWEGRRYEMIQTLSLLFGKSAEEVRLDFEREDIRTSD